MFRTIYEPRRHCSTLSYAIVVSLAFFLTLCVTPPAWSLEKGAAAPDFSLPSLEGRTTRLSDFRGRVIVLKLGTSWCATCGEQEEELGKAATRLKESGAVVVDVFLQESAEDVRDYLVRKKRLNDRVVLLDDDQVRRAYGIYLIPRLLVIDRALRVVRDGSLMLSEELVETVRRAAASRP